MLAELDLSFNRITGQYRDALITSNTSTTRLKVNRLSGTLSVSDLSASTDLNILLGNIFSCGSLPPNDEHYGDYVCGSKILDASLAFLILIVGFVALILGLIVWVCYRKGGTLSKSNGGDNSSTFRGYDFQQKGLWRRIVSLVRNQRCYFGVMATVQASSTPIRNARNIARFYFELVTMTKLWVMLCLLSMIVSIPIYVLKTTNDDATTHDFLYSWELSWAYTTGEMSALLLLSAWLCLICTFILVIVYILWVFNSNKIQRKRRSELENMDPLSHRKATLDSGDESDFVELWNIKTVFLLLTNNVVVIGVNMIYIYSTSLYLSNFHLFLIQLTVAAFKQFNSTFVLPYLCKTIKDPKKSLRVRLKISILQSLLVPCLVTAFEDPNCLNVSIFLCHNTVCQYHKCIDVFCDDHVALHVLFTSGYVSNCGHCG